MANDSTAVKTWQASAGLPGIDALHSFASNPRQLEAIPETTPTELPQRGPWYNSRAPIPAGEYWRDRYASIIPGITFSDTITTGEEIPQHPTETYDDPREKYIPVDRWTAKTTPSFYRFTRPFGQKLAHRFDGSHASMATQPRFGPMAFGDGRGIHRARNTQRNIPTPLDQQIIVEADQPSQTEVLARGSSLVQWW